MKLVENTLQSLMAKIVSFDQSLHENSSSEGQY